MQVQDSQYDFDQLPVFLHSFQQCLLYLLARASAITALITKGFFKFRTENLHFIEIAHQLTSCRKFVHILFSIVYTLYREDCITKKNGSLMTMKS